MKLLYKKLLLWTLLILHLALIFSFSMQDSEESAVISTVITEKVQTVEEFEEKIRNEESNDGTIAENSLKWIAKGKFLGLEKLFRKAAHVALFLILGLLINFLMNCYGIDRKFCVFISPVFAMSVGFFDETIQLFSLGRAGLLSDVFIDFSGAIMASLFFFAGGKIYEKNKEKRFKMDS